MDPLERLDIQQREHAAWVEMAREMRAIGFDLNTVDTLTFEQARLAMCRWALLYAEGFHSGAFTIQKGERR